MRYFLLILIVFGLASIASMKTFPVFQFTPIEGSPDDVPRGAGAW